MSSNKPYARTRDKSLGSKAGELLWFTQPENQDPQLYATVNQTIHNHTDVMGDWVTPGFSRISSAGDIVNNPMNKILDETSCGGGSYNHMYGTTHNYVDSSNGSVTRWQLQKPHADPDLLVVPSATLQSAIRKAKLECIHKIDSTPYSLMEDLFEAQETVNTLRRPLGTANKAADRFRKKAKSKKAQGMSAVQAISDAWLGVRMGFSPIIRSAIDVAESLDRIRIKPFPRRTARHTITESDTSVQVIQIGDYPTGWIDKKHTITASWKFTIRAGIMYETVTQTMSPFEYYGIRKKDVPETIWAVMPYSWAVDRFVDISSLIGGGINLLDPNVSIRAAWVTIETERQTSEVVTSSCSTSGSPNQTLTIIGDPLDRKCVEKVRHVWSPRVGDLVPPLENGFDDLLNTFDLLSLVTSKVKNPFK